MSVDVPRIEGENAGTSRPSTAPATSTQTSRRSRSLRQPQVIPSNQTPYHHPEYPPTSSVDYYFRDLTDSSHTVSDPPDSSVCETEGGCFGANENTYSSSAEAHVSGGTLEEEEENPEPDSNTREEDTQFNPEDFDFNIRK